MQLDRISLPLFLAICLLAQINTSPLPKILSNAIDAFNKGIDKIYSKTQPTVSKVDGYWDKTYPKLAGAVVGGAVGTGAFLATTGEVGPILAGAAGGGAGALSADLTTKAITKLKDGKLLIPLNPSSKDIKDFAKEEAISTAIGAAGGAIGVGVGGPIGEGIGEALSPGASSSLSSVGRFAGNSVGRFAGSKIVENSVEFLLADAVNSFTRFNETTPHRIELPVE